MIAERRFRRRREKEDTAPSSANATTEVMGWEFCALIMIGGLFIGLGTQKLADWFGGSGVDGTAASFAKLGLEPARENAV